MFRLGAANVVLICERHRVDVTQPAYLRCICETRLLQLLPIEGQTFKQVFDLSPVSGGVDLELDGRGPRLDFGGEHRDPRRPSAGLEVNGIAEVDPHALHLGELVERVRAHLASHTALLVTTERQCM